MGLIMSLCKEYRRFLNNTHRIRSKAETASNIPSTHDDWRFKYASVAILSEMWQSWCRFCYSIVLASCRGTNNRDGTIVPPRAAENSRGRVAYEVYEYARGRIPRKNNRFRYLSQEPTWGDVNMLLRALPDLGLSNSAKLITAFGISTQSPSHLQIVRNACYHLNSETIGQVRSIQPFYIGRVNRHPYELMWCLESVTRSDAVYFWIDELEIIAALAT